jgi:hypothetical protein
VFRAFTAAYPGHHAAALAAYWLARTEPMLQFEEAHPGRCLRVRYEDLADEPDRAIHDICTFLGLAEDVRAALPWPDRDDDDALPTRPSIPVDQIPGPLHAQVNATLTRLSYPPMPDA